MKFERKPILLSSITKELAISYSYDDYVDNIKQITRCTQIKARGKILALKEK